MKDDALIEFLASVFVSCVLGFIPQAIMYFDILLKTECKAYLFNCRIAVILITFASRESAHHHLKKSND